MINHDFDDDTSNSNQAKESSTNGNREDIEVNQGTEDNQVSKSNQTDIEGKSKAEAKKFIFEMTGYTPGTDTDSEYHHNQEDDFNEPSFVATTTNFWDRAGIKGVTVAGGVLMLVGGISIMAGSLNSDLTSKETPKRIADKPKPVEDKEDIGELKTSSALGSQKSQLERLNNQVLERSKDTKTATTDVKKTAESQIAKPVKKLAKPAVNKPLKSIKLATTPINTAPVTTATVPINDFSKYEIPIGRVQKKVPGQRQVVQSPQPVKPPVQIPKQDSRVMAVTLNQAQIEELAKKIESRIKRPVNNSTLQEKLARLPDQLPAIEPLEPIDIRLTSLQVMSGKNQTNNQVDNKVNKSKTVSDKQGINKQSAAQFNTVSSDSTGNTRKGNVTESGTTGIDTDAHLEAWLNSVVEYETVKTDQLIANSRLRRLPVRHGIDPVHNESARRSIEEKGSHFTENSLGSSSSPQTLNFTFEKDKTVEFIANQGFDFRLDNYQNAKALAVKEVSSQQAQKGVDLQVSAGYGLTVSFQKTGERISQAWLADPSKIVFSTNVKDCAKNSNTSCNGAANVIFLRQIKEINFPNLTSSSDGGTQLVILTNSKEGQRQYLFRILPVKGNPEYSSVIISPSGESNFNQAKPVSSPSINPNVFINRQF